jgi:large subunit ribosomal protein L22
MEARAIKRYTNSSPRKMMLIVDMIRGKNVEEALTVLHFSTKHASKVCEKTLRSAVANLQQKEEKTRISSAQLFVKEAYVDQAPTMKRILPAPMGRAFRIRKRSHHLTLVVADIQSKKGKK